MKPKMPKIELKPNSTLDDRQIIFDLLEDFNYEQANLEPEVPLAILLHDDNKTITGGLWGLTYYRWLFIELLIVPEKIRRHGLGTKMMCMAEQEALRRGCHGVWSDTFSFQALGFYEKLGYTIFGVIPEYPPGHCRYFVMKQFTPCTSERGVP